MDTTPREMTRKSDVTGTAQDRPSERDEEGGVHAERSLDTEVRLDINAISKSGLYNKGLNNEDAVNPPAQITVCVRILARSPSQRGSGSTRYY
jgi:hypothetical protein